MLQPLADPEPAHRTDDSGQRQDHDAVEWGRRCRCCGVVASVVVEGQSFGELQDGHEGITHEAGEDRGHHEDDPKSSGERRVTIVGDVGLLHGTAARGNSVLDDRLRDPLALAVAVSVAHRSTMVVMLRPDATTPPSPEGLRGVAAGGDQVVRV